MQGFLHFLVPIISRTYKIVSFFFHFLAINVRNCEVVATLDRTNQNILPVRLAKNNSQLHRAMVGKPNQVAGGENVAVVISQGSLLHFASLIKHRSGRWL